MSERRRVTENRDGRVTVLYAKTTWTKGAAWADLAADPLMDADGHEIRHGEWHADHKKSYWKWFNWSMPT